MSSEILDRKNESLLAESEVPYTPIALRFGAILGAISVIFSLLQFMMGWTWVSWVSFIVLVGGLVYVAREHRTNDLGGFMSFGRSFGLTFMVGAVSSLIGTIFNGIYMNAVPNAWETIAEKTLAEYEKYNMPEEQAETSLELTKWMMTTPSGLAAMFAGALVLIAILALIISLVMKRDRPMFN
jgi:hypothetical protein